MPFTTMHHHHPRQYGISRRSIIVYRFSMLHANFNFNLLAFWLLLRFSFFLFLRKLSSLFVSAPLFFCCFTSNSTGRRDSNSKRKWSNPSIQMDDFFLDESTMMISDRINRVVLDTRIFVAQRGYCYVCTRLIRCNFFDYLRWRYVKLYPRPTRLFPSS